MARKMRGQNGRDDGYRNRLDDCTWHGSEQSLCIPHRIYGDRKWIDAEVDEFRRRAASEGKKQDEIELEKRERALDDPRQEGS
jgi:hypothetical protein